MKTSLTQEQKEWYFIGYFMAHAQYLAKTLNITDDKAIEILVSELKRRATK